MKKFFRKYLDPWFLESIFKKLFAVWIYIYQVWSLTLIVEPYKDNFKILLLLMTGYLYTFVTVLNKKKD